MLLTTRNNLTSDISGQHSTRGQTGGTEQKNGDTPHGE